MVSKHKVRLNYDIRPETLNHIDKIITAEKIPRNTFVSESIKYVLSNDSRIKEVIKTIKELQPHKIRRFNHDQA